MKLSLPKKFPTGNLLYVVILARQSKPCELYGVYKNNTACLFLLSEEELESLKTSLHDDCYCYALSGVWTLSKPGEYKLAGSSTPLWTGVENPEDFIAPSLLMSSAFCPRQYPKDFIDLVDEMDVPKKMRYKRGFVCGQVTEGVTFLHFDSTPYIWMKADAHTSILGVLTTSQLDEWVEIIYASDPFSLVRFEQWLQQAGEGRITIDTETFDPEEVNGWQALVGWRGCIRTLQLYSPEYNACLIVDFGGRGHYVSFEVRKQYGERLQRACHKREVVFQNALFDLLFLEYQLGALFYTAKIRDTLYMSKQLYCGIGQMSHSLDAICKRELGEFPDKSLQKSDFGLPMIAAQYNYGAEDTRLTDRCFVALTAKLNQIGNNLLFSKIDNAYVLVCHMIRSHGIWVDDVKLEEVYLATRDYFNTQAKEWEDTTGLSVTVGHAALRSYLEAEGVDVPNTQAATLKKVSHQYTPLKSLINARVAKKRLDYLKGMKTNKSYRTDGCITPGIQVSARQGLGRTSQSDLVKGMNVAQNCQNMAKENREYPELPDYRPAFAAPEGYSFFSLDLAAAHGRIAVYASQATGVLDKFEEGEDLHTYNAAIVARRTLSPTDPYYPVISSYRKSLAIRALNLNEPLPPRIVEWVRNNTSCQSDDDIQKFVKALYKQTKHYRNLTKTTYYLAINIGGPVRLQTSLRDVGIEVSVEECREILKGIKDAVPEIYDYVFAKKKEADNCPPFKPSELKLLDPSTVDWPSLTSKEFKEITKKPVEFGYVTTHINTYRYIPKYVQSWGTDWKKGKYRVESSVSDVSATLWQNPEAKVIKMAQIRLLQEYIVPNNYHLKDPSTGLAKVWIANNCHDEVVVIAHDDLALEVATIQKNLVDEEWSKICGTIKGTEGTPQDCIGKNWGETK